MGWGRTLHLPTCLALSLLAACCTQTLAAPAWLPGQYPNPIKYPEACGRGDKVGWVCDPDNVLARDQADGVHHFSRFLSEQAEV